MTKTEKEDGEISSASLASITPRVAGVRVKSDRGYRDDKREEWDFMLFEERQDASGEREGDRTGRQGFLFDCFVFCPLSFDFVT